MRHEIAMMFLGCGLWLGAGCSSGSTEQDAGVDAPEEDAGRDGGADPGSDSGGGDEEPIEDLCLGVWCDDPPADTCGPGEQELWIYEEIGDCDPDTGECAYDPQAIKCMSPCVDAHCDGIDPCVETYCNRPPDNICEADGTTITRFERPGTCDPDTGRCQYTTSQDTCEHGCRQNRCQPPPGAGAALRVPAGTQLCSFFWAGDVLLNYLEAGRLTLREGVHGLHFDVQEFELDWIETLELAPEGELAPAAGPMRFMPRFEGTQQEGQYVLDVEQIFLFDSREYHLTGTLAYDVRDGRVLQPVLEIASDTSARYAGFILDGQYAPDGLLPRYSGCQSGSYGYQLTVTVDNADVIGIDFFYGGLGCPGTGGCAGEPFPGLIRTATLTRDATSRTVNGYFDLAFTTQHHEDGKSFLIILGEPVGAIHALHLPIDHQGQELSEVRYLDALLGLIETRDITSVEGLDW